MPDIVAVIQQTVSKTEGKLTGLIQQLQLTAEGCNILCRLLCFYVWPLHWLSVFTGLILMLLVMIIVYMSINVEVDDAAVGYPRVLVFARGGHVVHRSHQNIIADSVVRLLTHVSHDNDASASVPHWDTADQTLTRLSSIACACLYRVVQKKPGRWPLLVWMFPSITWQHV